VVGRIDQADAKVRLRNNPSGSNKENRAVELLALLLLILMITVAWLKTWG
jgi:hypothetical protein